MNPAFFLFALVITSIVAWITHIVVCVQAAAWTGSAIAILILGVVFPPVGILHGVCSWFGFTWM